MSWLFETDADGASSTQSSLRFFCALAPLREISVVCVLEGASRELFRFHESQRRDAEVGGEVGGEEPRGSAEWFVGDRRRMAEGGRGKVPQGWLHVPEEQVSVNLG